MNVQVLARALAVVVALGVPALGSAQPEAAGPPPDQAVQPGEPPPHLIRLEGSGAQVVRDGTALALEPGDPVLFGDRVDIGAAYGQVLWSEGSRVALDHGGRLKPEAHYFTRSKHPWIVLPPDVPAFEQLGDPGKAGARERIMAALAASGSGPAMGDWAREKPEG